MSLNHEPMESKVSDGVLNAADVIREKEAYRYLNTANVHAYVDSAAQPLPAARPSGDSALTAFAQLSLLRLKAKRALVCLLDRTYSYTIAEATVSSKLRPTEYLDTEHGLLFCGTATRHAFSLPSLVLQTAVESLLSAGESMFLPLPVSMVPDLRKDDRFCSLPAVNADDDARFCAGVPIKSYNGAFIGLFYVLDSQPRTALSDADAEFMRDISKTIMDHLNCYRLSLEFERSTRMVRGLGSFVENRATMSGLPGHAQHTSPEEERGREGALNTLQQEFMLKTDAAVRPNTGRLSNSSVETWLGQDKSSAETPLPQDNKPSWGDSEAVSTTSTTSAPMPATDLQQLFSRAANIIRESIEVEGVLFFDASVGYWGGSLESNKRDSSTGGSSTASTTSTASSSSDDDSLPTRSTIRTNQEETTCDVFGFSMTHGSSIDGKKASAGHLTVPERFLRILLRRYPMGKIFNFTADGRPVSDTETEEDYVPSPNKEATVWLRRRKHHSYSRANEAALIIKVFPGARSILAFPLWDSHRERWFAGGVAWTRTPKRVFSIRGELSYLRVFGIVAMAEVARMDAQTADKSKAVLLSSISHELRSPLHGILGGIEILQGTEIDVFQSNVIHTVEACGAMLLDTLEHLLTQSKVNQSVRMAKLRRREERNQPRPNEVKDQGSDVVDPSTNVEIDAVVEEVLESIFAGYEFMHLSRRSKQSADECLNPSTTPADWPGIRDTSSSSDLEKIQVMLDIKPAASWMFVIETAALRRVVMNLFGNALKYITAGYIKVTVSQREVSKKTNPQMSEIKITFEDTGKGISPEYLSNHLFKPFSQEDPLSQGTGLGLSITHQIVASLDGKIEVQSTVGQGTIMSVLLKLARPALTEGPPTKSMFLARTRRIKGLRVLLFGFSDDAAMAPAEISKADQGWQLPRTAIETLCRDWLHMDVLAASETSIRPDLYIATQSGAQELIAMNVTGVVVQPVVVICSSAALAHDLTKSAKTSDQFGVFEYISQPCGPRKLAKTLTLCLDRWAAIQVEKAVPVPSWLPLFARTYSNPSPLSVPLSPLSVSDPSPGPFKDTHQPQAGVPQRRASHSHAPDRVRPVAPFLLVDDNDVNLKLLSAYLTRKSYPFATATDGVLAVEAYKAARGKFSCIFMDIQMPRMDGIAAARAIREYERAEKLEAVTVVVLTGLATDEKQREAEASGVNEFFAKPVRLKALDVILERTAKPVG